MVRKKTKGKQVAFGGIIAAVSVCLMIFTGIIPLLTYSIPIITGLLLMIIVIEFGKRWAITVYAAVSVISLLFVADKESAVIYVAFFGYYPVLKPVIEKIKVRVLEWILKFAVFNISIVAAYFVLIKLFALDLSSEHFPYRQIVIVLLILGNVLFLLYDLSFTKIVTVYINIWSKYVRKIIK